MKKQWEKPQIQSLKLAKTENHHNKSGKWRDGFWINPAGHKTNSPAYSG